MIGLLLDISTQNYAKIPPRTSLNLYSSPLTSKKKPTNEKSRYNVRDDTSNCYSKIFLELTQQSIR